MHSNKNENGSQIRSIKRASGGGGEGGGDIRDENSRGEYKKRKTMRRDKYSYAQTPT